MQAHIPHKTSDWLLLHWLVILYGFTPIIGKLITLQAVSLVWWRLLFACIALFIFLIYKKINLQVDRGIAIKLLANGAIVGAHWFFFYQAIKISNVNIALSGFATMTLFTAFIEPWVYKRRINLLEILLGFVTLLGLWIILEATEMAWEGLTYGILAALTASLFVTFNGKLSHKVSTYNITAYELSGAFLLLTLLHFVLPQLVIVPIVQTSDLIWLIVLSTIATVYPFVQAIKLARIFSPYTLILTNNLEPVYGILLAFIFFGKDEIMNPMFYLGALLILACVFTYPALKYWKRTNKQA